MMRIAGAVAVLLASAIALSACVVEGPPPGRPGCVWVRGHYGAYGGWHPGHCA